MAGQLWEVGDMTVLGWLTGQWQVAGELEAVTSQYPQESLPGSMNVSKGSWE